MLLLILQLVLLHLCHHFNFAGIIIPLAVKPFEILWAEQVLEELKPGGTGLAWTTKVFKLTHLFFAWSNWESYFFFFFSGWSSKREEELLVTVVEWQGAADNGRKPLPWAMYPWEVGCSKAEPCQQAFKYVPGIFSFPLLKKTVAVFVWGVLHSFEQGMRKYPSTPFVAHSTEVNTSLLSAMPWLKYVHW